MTRLNQAVIVVLLLLSASGPAVGTNKSVSDTTLRSVSVNGGADTANPGVTCLRVNSAVSDACPHGWIAIRNNNKELMAAALQAKATNARLLLYYDDAGGPFHCPQLVFTPCSVTSITFE